MKIRVVYATMRSASIAANAIRAAVVHANRKRKIADESGLFPPFLWIFLVLKDLIYESKYQANPKNILGSYKEIQNFLYFDIHFRSRRFHDCYYHSSLL